MTKSKKTKPVKVEEVIEQPKQAAVTSDPGNDIDDILGSYKAPAVVEPDPNFSAAPEQPGDLSDPTKYYQTGLKKGQPRPGGGRKKSVNDGNVISSQIISGALFITLIDLLFPLLITAINNRFSKTKIDSSDLQLTSKERAELEPLANEAVQYININGHPLVLMSVAFLGMYSIKFAAVKMAKQ